MRPHLVELAIHVVGRTGGRPLEHHVLEEMAHAGHLVGLVAGAGLDEETQRRRVGLGVALGDDFQTVGQAYAYETPTGTSNRLGPSVTMVKSRRRMLGQVGVDALAGQGVDQAGRPRPACGRGPGDTNRGRCDELRDELDSCCMISELLMRALSRIELLRLDPLGQPDQLAEHHVQRFLGPLGAGAGIAEDAGPVAQRVIAWHRPCSTARASRALR